MAIPAEIHGQRYLSLATFRKTGVAVYTAIWFAEDGGKLCFMTNSKLGKVKRLRNNAPVKIAPCTIRGKITGPEFEGSARILPPEDAARVRLAINAKYWLARVPLLWRNTDMRGDHARRLTPASVSFHALRYGQWLTLETEAQQIFFAPCKKQVLRFAQDDNLFILRSN